MHKCYSCLLVFPSSYELNSWSVGGMAFARNERSRLRVWAAPISRKNLAPKLSTDHQGWRLRARNQRRKRISTVRRYMHGHHAANVPRRLKTGERNMGMKRLQVTQTHSADSPRHSHREDVRGCFILQLILCSFSEEMEEYTRRRWSSQ